ncbi:NUDIX domain-containing protein [Altererythrobacter xixiisoli]|uniref:GDP-mannose pyrophosphatase n=1 Tax=Croceibacterium xixiisoli TaxID=1476466 RepID=A0A6I4TT55_9SPHN|nr:NUDIX domain-containing protein [Croceibacterium xixiisoli]
MPPDAQQPEQIEWSGKFITAKRRGRWEYVSRARGIRAAVILPVDQGRVILVEQFRVPLGRNCLELPAGLIGDEVGAEGEGADSAAARELEEETGFRAEHWEDLGEFFSSPGMVTESFTLLKASGLTRVGPGGGVEGENITVHEVALADIAEVIGDFRARGVAIDVKLLLLLGAGIVGESK